MPTLEVICVCQGANSFHSVISWHLVDMFLLCTQRVRLEACVCCGDTALMAQCSSHRTLRELWILTGHLALWPLSGRRCVSA